MSHSFYSVDEFLVLSEVSLYGIFISFIRLILWYHHHHHILLSLQGHRASTKRRHLILFLASCFTSFHLFPSPNASLWTDLLHVCLGLPLFRCSCGFQSIISLSMVSCPFLSVCPIPIPFPSSNLYWYLGLFSCSPKFLIWNHFRPVDVQNSS